MADPAAAWAAAVDAIDAAERAAHTAEKGGDCLAAAYAADAAVEALRAVLAVESDPNVLDAIAADIERLRVEAAAWRTR